MKKFFAILFAVTALVAVSCQKPAGNNTPSDQQSQVDLTELDALITECEALANAATTDDYPQAAIDAFKGVISDVKEAAKAATSQTVVTSLVARLKEAKATFLAAELDTIPADAVTFALSFDEGTGTELKTTGKYQWTAKLEEGAKELFPDTKLPEFVEGKVGKAMHFADASHLSIADYIPAALGGSAISISCWVKPDELRASNYIVSYQSWHVWKFQTQDGGKPFFTLATDKGITDMDNETDGSVEVGKWAHLVVSWGNDTGDVNMYVNGALTKTWKGTEDHGGNHGPGAVIRDPEEAAILELAIGSDETINMKRGTENAEISAWDAYFHGAIDELAVYNVALTQGQVSKLYNSQK